MKFIIASDIHGSAYWCEQLLSSFQKEQAEKLVLLGDILYHGPRNNFPCEYAPKEVFAMLNAVKDKITAIRGNCDSEVDQMVLDFPMLADYALLQADHRLLFATHGHLFNKDNPPLLNQGDILLNGHFHTPCIEVTPAGYVYANCGSVALPKEGYPHTYLVYENDTLTLKDLATGQTVKEYIF